MKKIQRQILLLFSTKSHIKFFPFLIKKIKIKSNKKSRANKKKPTVNKKETQKKIHINRLHLMYIQYIPMIQASILVLRLEQLHFL